MWDLFSGIVIFHFINNVYTAIRQSDHRLLPQILIQISHFSTEFFFGFKWKANVLSKKE